MTSPEWRKSTRSSDGTSSQCVEVAQFGGTVGVRDGKRPDAGHLTLHRDQFVALIARVKRAELDL